MSNHLYNAKREKLKWFIKRFGLKELVLKPGRIVFAPVIIKLKKPGQFRLGEENYNLFFHKYNMTWANERCVEIPIVLKKIKGFEGRKLEIGNVLSHYIPTNWEVLDKYEQGTGVINQDVLGFKPKKKYDLIVSISTFEHIGYDDDCETSSSEKIKAVLDHVINNVLDLGGKLVITIPMGYNPELDSLIEKEELNYLQQKFLKKKGSDEWIEVSKEDALKCKYGKPFSYASCIMVGEYLKS
ncbi:Uncharacterised protein [uncultured archaeon]|nr:Uncharacterised protein [uncultured archaeon]